MAAIFDFNGSWRLGERKKFLLWGRSTVKNKKKKGGGGGVKILALSPPPTPTVYSNSKSNVAGLINDRELITLAPTNKKPTLQAMKRVMLRPESNNFALAVQPLPSGKKMYLFHFDTSHHLETMKYEARNKTLSLERLNYQNATDRVSVFRATGKLHAIPNRGKKIVIYIIFSSWPWSSLLLIEIFFSPSRKVLNLRFCPVYITVTSSPSILEWA